MSTKNLFKVGDIVCLRSDLEARVAITKVISGGEHRYEVLHNGTEATYYERQLQIVPTESEERGILTIRELHAHLTSLKILSPSTTNLFSLRMGRVQFIPYQYRPVLKLIRADRPRLLIADEVGVGKTIEAGLIIKELRARLDISSILIICPKALIAEHKWFNEMKRFDEEFVPLDGRLLRHCLRETHLGGEWPERYAKAMLPFSLFNWDHVYGRALRRGGKSRGLRNLDPPPKFDLVIVDEAHHIRNTETFLHQGVRLLCDNAQAVLLLTATPVQLGSDDLFTLLNVIRPDLVIDQVSFQQMSEPNPSINDAIHHCRKAEPNWQMGAYDCLERAAQTEWGRMFLLKNPSFEHARKKLQENTLSDADRVGMIRTMEELYTFSPIINRTRRRDIGEFTTRKPETVKIDFTAEQQNLHDDLLDVIARILARCHGWQNVKFMMTTIRRQAASCLYGLAPLLRDILSGKLDQLEMMEASDGDFDVDFGFIEEIKNDIEDLVERADNLDPCDPKIEEFIQILCKKNQLPNNKAMVFSTFRHTLAYLAEHTKSVGLRFGLIHGGVGDDERASLRKRFALPKEDTSALDVLLSSEVGCEGLDFQHCDFMINFDLPWNPMKIEQRIGRIDRYGQKSEAVAIVNFITPRTVDADIYERCLWRIGVFEHAVGGNEEILGEITQEIHNIAENFDLNPEERAQKFQQTADNKIRKIREEQELESKQADLFGLDVPNQSWEDELEAAKTFWLSPEAIRSCVETYLSGRLRDDTQHILGEKPLKSLRLNQEARKLLLTDYKHLSRAGDPVARKWENWLEGTGGATLPITFDQETATENPETTYLSVLHPLVRQAAQFMETAKPKYCALSAQTNTVPPGIYHFAIYRWAKRGIKPDELLVTVADDPQLEALLFDLLQTAVDSGRDSLQESKKLEERHYQKWSEARDEHIAENRQIIEHKIQSLTTSHRARQKVIEDQVTFATNDKIQLMKKGELARANADFDRRISELQQSVESADIHSSLVILGSILIGGK